MALTLNLPVQHDGVHLNDDNPTFTPEQIEAKRLADESTESARLAAIEAEKNKTIKTPEEVEVERIEAEKLANIDANINKVLIDDIEFKLDTNGNAVKADGSIHMTKEELDKLSDSNNDPNDIDPFEVIQNVLEYKPEVNGEPVQYERTQDGLNQLLVEASEHKAEILAKSIVARYFEENPDVAQRRTYKVLNGTLDGFNEQPVWNKLDIETLTDEKIIDIIKYERSVKGDNEATTNYFIEGIKKDGKLKEFGTSSIQFLAQKQITENKLAQDKIASDELIETARINKYWNEVDTLLNTKKLNIKGEEFQLPSVFRINEGNGKIVTKTLADFNEYIKKPLTFNINGSPTRLTQLQYDMYLESINTTPAVDTYNALRRFLKNDDSQLVKAKAQQERVQEVRKLVTKTPAKSGKIGGSSFKINLPIKSNTHS
jgi:hypothetical protein